MIKALVFDCFGVLIHGSLGYFYSITPEENHLELRDLNRSSDYGYISLEQYMAGIAQLSGKPIEEIKTAFHSQHIRDERMLAFVRQQRETYKVALLSNVATHVMDELISPQEQRELFDVVVLSSSIGMTKPSKEIYDYTLAQLGVLPEEAVMIDDLAHNVDGARAAGMHGVQFVSQQQLDDELQSLTP